MLLTCELSPTKAFLFNHPRTLDFKSFLLEMTYCLFQYKVYVFFFYILRVSFKGDFPRCVILPTRTIDDDGHPVPREMDPISAKIAKSVKKFTIKKFITRIISVSKVIQLCDCRVAYLKIMNS